MHITTIRNLFNRKFITGAYQSFTRTERVLFIIALTLFTVSGVVMLGRAYYHFTAIVPVAGGTYQEGAIGQPVNINPILTQGNDIDRDIGELVYSSLLQSDGKGGTKNDLATHYERSEDGLEWTVFLRDDIVWHDGERFDADDVIFTIETVQDPDTDSPLFNSWQGVVVERVSALEVKFFLRNRYAAFEENLKELKIIPEHVFALIPRANIRLSEYRLEPIGTGPYQFSDLQKRKDGFITSYTLVRNTEYYQNPPFIDNIIFRFFQNDGELLNAFNTRMVDGFGGARPEQIEKLTVPPRIIPFSIPRYFAIFMNENLAPALSDREVRTALNLATDKRSVLKFVFSDYGSVVNAPIVESMMGYDEEFSAFTYDPETASTTLTDAGWSFASETSTIRSNEDDEELRFTMIVPDTAALTHTAELIRDNWKKIGVQLDIKTAPISEITHNHMEGRDYEMLLFGNILNTNTDLFAFWHSSQRLHPGLNLALYANDDVDALIESSRQTLDKDERIQDIKDIVSTIQEDVPALFLFSPDYLYVTNNKLSGIEKTVILTPSQRFLLVERWAIKEARVFQ